MNRAKIIYHRGLYDVFTSHEVCEILGIKHSWLMEVANKTKIGQLSIGTYRFTKAQIEKLKNYFTWKDQDSMNQ